MYALHRSSLTRSKLKQPNRVVRTEQFDGGNIERQAETDGAVLQRVEGWPKQVYFCAVVYESLNVCQMRMLGCSVLTFGERDEKSGIELNLVNHLKQQREAPQWRTAKTAMNQIFRYLFRYESGPLSLYHCIDDQMFS